MTYDTMLSAKPITKEFSLHSIALQPEATSSHPTTAQRIASSIISGLSNTLDRVTRLQHKLTSGGKSAIKAVRAHPRKTAALFLASLIAIIYLKTDVPNKPAFTPPTPNQPTLENVVAKAVTNSPRTSFTKGDIVDGVVSTVLAGGISLAMFCMNTCAERTPTIQKIVELVRCSCVGGRAAAIITEMLSRSMGRPPQVSYASYWSDKNSLGVSLIAVTGLLQFVYKRIF